MFGCIGWEGPLTGKRLLSAGRMAVLVSLLAGCTSVPDAINPVEWYKGAQDLVTGRERPEVSSPRPAKADFPDINDSAKTAAKPKAAASKEKVSDSLAPDRSNSKYAQPVRREAAPTKPLSKRTPAAETTQTAAAAETAPAGTPAVPPKPQVTATELPPPPAAQVAQAQQTSTQPAATQQGSGHTPTLGKRMALARDEGPAAPPATVNMVPPARADIPEVVPVPGTAVAGAKPRTPRALQEQYDRRLAESANTVVRPDIVPPMPRLASESFEEPVRLVPPGSRKGKASGKGFAAPAPDFAPAASFQVASVDFRGGSAKLTDDDMRAIAQVAKLQRAHGGVVRVVGFAPAPLLSAGYDSVQSVMAGFSVSQDRANAVARELTRRGVPASKVMIGADSAPQLAAMPAGAQVFLDY